MRERKKRGAKVCPSNVIGNTIMRLITHQDKRAPGRTGPGPYTLGHLYDRKYFIFHLPCLEVWTA
jgi:hypothetical protein